MTVKKRPDGYHSVTPYLIVDDANDALAWYGKSFAAVEIMRLPLPGGKVGHAEFDIGDSRVMIADSAPDMGFNAPAIYGGSPVSLMIYLDDVDATFQNAVENGAEIVKPLEDQFYGDRMGTVKDPFGHTWSLATHIEDVSSEVLQERMAKMCGE